MKFIRNHNDFSLVQKDKILEKHSDLDKIEPEIFDNIKMFRLQTDSFDLTFKEDDDNKIDAIIETINFYTIVSHNQTKYQVIKWDEVLNVEFEC